MLAFATLVVVVCEASGLFAEMDVDKVFVRTGFRLEMEAWVFLDHLEGLRDDYPLLDGETPIEGIRDAIVGPPEKKTIILL